MFVSLTQNLRSNTTANVTVVAFWEGHVLSSVSKSIKILEAPPPPLSETTSVETSPPIDNSTEVVKPVPIGRSSLIYGVIGTCLVLSGIAFFFVRRKLNSGQGLQATESHIENVSDEIEEPNHPSPEMPPETPHAIFSDLSSISRQLRGIQSVDDFARELGISSEEVIQLINERNAQVSDEKRWRIVAGGQLIIPSDPMNQNSNY